jgi:hypothetical protein
MNLKDLQKEIPCKWRVQSFSKNKPSAQCIAYIDARDVMDLLDEVVGVDKWQDDYKFIEDGKDKNGDNKYRVMAGLGIKCGDEWVWKWDTGTESQTEGEKGQVSDAFKRAGVKWGIGRFLYSLGIKYVPANEVKTSSNYPYPVDNTGKRIWGLTEYINNLK